jgi:hypothetical protein
MKHLSEEDLVLQLYREGMDEEGPRHHLEACAVCREELDVLRRVLAEVEAVAPPERPEDYEARVWARVSRALPDARRTGRGVAFRYLVAAAALATLSVASFLAGRLWAPSAPEASRSTEIRERVLLVALGEHLEESQVLLLEVANRDVGTTPLERERAGELLHASRLYRQTASRLGEVATADVLEEVERLLLDVSHGPESEAARNALRVRLEKHDLLFKLRVLEANVRAREPRSEPASVKKF